MCNVKLLDDFVEKWPGSPWGPGHVVIDDANIDDYNLDWCIQYTKVCLAEEDVRFAGRREELEATLAFLQELRAMSFESRFTPNDYFCGDHLEFMRERQAEYEKSKSML